MKVEVKINGKSYPCRPTMGAMLRFKQETGREVTEITNNSISDLCTYLYCCVASAAAADKVKFSMTLIEFADALDPEDLNAFVEQMKQGKTESAEEKKR